VGCLLAPLRGWSLTEKDEKMKRKVLSGRWKRCATHERVGEDAPFYKSQ
jgi:hypothetical protein